MYPAIGVPIATVKATRSVALDVWVDSPARSLAGDAIRHGDEGPYDLLDVSATRDEGRENVTVSLINRSATDDLETTIELVQGVPGQEITVQEVNGPEVTATNDFAHPENVTVQRRPVTTGGGTLRLIVPAHTHQVFTIRLT